MIRHAATLACLVPLFASACAADLDKPPVLTAPIQLFDGRDLVGWAPYHKGKADAEKIWTVADGILHCAGKPNGYLRTEQVYADYKLTVEWRFTVPGNTGMLVHINGIDQVWPECVECQGMTKRQGDMYFWGGMTCNELVKPPGVPMKVPSAEHETGQWNTFQVLCAKDVVTIVVNDHLMNRVTGCSHSSGRIGIQCEGAELDIRKVEIAPLDP